MAEQGSNIEELQNLTSEMEQSAQRRPPSGALNFTWLANPFSQDGSTGDVQGGVQLEGATVDESCDELLHEKMTEALGVLKQSDKDELVEVDELDNDAEDEKKVDAELQTRTMDEACNNMSFDNPGKALFEVNEVCKHFDDEGEEEVPTKEGELDMLIAIETENDADLSSDNKGFKESLSNEVDRSQPVKKLIVKKTDSDKVNLLENEEEIDEISDSLVEDSEVTLPSVECGVSDSEVSDDPDRSVDDVNVPKSKEDESAELLACVADKSPDMQKRFEKKSHDLQEMAEHLDIKVDIKHQEAESIEDVHQLKVDIQDAIDKKSDAAVKFGLSVGNVEAPMDHLPFSKYVDMIELSRHSSPANTREDAHSVNEEMLKKTMKIGKPEHVKMTIRHAHWSMDQELRQNLWMLQCRHQHRASSHDIFSEFASELFPKGEYMDIRLPSFVDLNHTNNYFLNDEGVLNVKKVLSVLEHSSPDIVYSPLLYSYVALFLHFMDAPDCYNCIDSLLHESVAGYIAQTKVSFEASKLVIRDLAKKYAKSGYVLLVRNCSNIDSMFDSWNSWLFQDLPFPYLLRIIDCYLHEGVKVLYRVTLALLILFAKHQPKKSRSSRRESFGSTLLNNLRQFCREPPVSVDKLLKVGFGVRGLTRKEINRLQVKHEMYINSTKHLHTDQNGGNISSNMRMSRSFSGPIVLQNIDSNMLSADMLFAIWTWLPQRFAVCQPELLYTSEEHGTSLVTLYQRVENYQPTVIVIKSTNDEIFGAFCSAFWRERRETSSTMLSYFGTGETFIFALQPERKKYEWVGLKGGQIPNTAHMFQAGDRNCLIIGGGHGEAIYLDENLLHCRTEKCDTFNNEPLCQQEDFICKVVEVYGFQ